MSDLAVTAAAVRVIAGGSPEDTLTFNAKDAYDPALGDLVGISDADEVAPCCATVATGPVEPIGVVTSVRQVRTSAGGTGYRVTVQMRGLIDGFASLTPGARLYSSVTAGKIADADASSTTTILARCVGLAVTETAIMFSLPASHASLDTDTP